MQSNVSPFKDEKAFIAADVQQAQSPMPPLLLQYWQVVLRLRWAIAGIIAATLVAGLIVTVLATPRYTATTRLEISRSQQNVTNVGQLDSREDAGELEFYQTQYALLQARSLAERVARKLRLSQSDEFFEAHGESADDSGILGISGSASPNAERARRERKAVDLLLENSSISPIRGSALVDISYTSAVPELSSQIANAWASEFIASTIDRRYASTADARDFLEKRLNELRQRLEQSERQAVAYAARRGIIALGQSTGADGKTQSDRTLVANNLDIVSNALAAATAERIAAQARLQSGSNKSVTGDPLISNTTTAQLRQRRAELASDYAKMMVQFDPEYPAAEALAQQIAVLDASIAREEGRLSGRSTANLRSDYQAALTEERQLRSRVEDLKQELQQQRSDGIQYAIYQREADTNRQLYDALLQRYKEIGVSGVGANNIAVVDRAPLPEKPSSPNLLLNLAVALLAGVGLAGLAAFILNQIDESLRDPSQVSRLLGVPFLGSVPENEEGDAREALSDPKSAMSEAYLSIRSNLAFSTDHGVPKSFMVTSTRESEGKSTTGIALAMILGRVGKRVVLVDGDMRNPSVHRRLDLDNVRGVSNYLAGDDNWRNFVRSSTIDGVSVITAGPIPPSAAELLSSERMSMLVDELLTEFDQVILDSPPVLGLADAPLLSRAVEGSVFVVESERVSVRGIKAALGRLESVSAQVFGVVLTKLKTSHAGYGYGYGYQYTYGHQGNE